MLFPAAARLEPGRKLTYRQALALGAKKNLGLLADRAERERLALLPESTYEDFVPALKFNLDYDDASPITGDSRDRRLQYGAGLDWKSTVGTKVEVGVDVDQRLSGVTTSATTGVTSPSRHGGDISFSVTQPLLKDGWKDGAASELGTANHDRSIQNQLFRVQLNDLLKEVDKAYWALAFAQADQTIKVRSRDRARSQFEDTKENIRRGIVADVEIYVVEESLVIFEQERIRAHENLQLARRKLAQLLNLKGSEALVAADSLDTLPRKVPARARAISRALARNPGVLVQRLRLGRSRVLVAYQKNQALPALDLVTSLTLNGLDSSYSDAWKDIVTANRPDARIGLVFKVPLFRGPLDANLRRSKLDARRKLLQLQNEESSVRFLVGNLLTQLDGQRRRLDLARRRVKLSNLKLGAELEKYKNGISTLANVVRFQRELDQSLISLRRLQRDVHQAHAGLLYAQGVLHRAAGVGLKGN